MPTIHNEGMRALLVGSVLLLACGGNVETASTDASVDSSTTTDTRPETPRFDVCSGPGQCILDITGCCGKCGDAVLSDYDAINRDQAAAHRAAVCTDPAPACPKCATMMNPNLVAFCRESRCVGVDVRTDVVAECAKDDDCRLRAGNGCCEACSVVDVSQLIALSKTRGGELEAQVCDPLAGACPPCVPVYPSGVTATCNTATKRCQVTVK